MRAIVNVLVGAAAGCLGFVTAFMIQFIMGMIYAYNTGSIVPAEGPMVFFASNLFELILSVGAGVLYFFLLKKKFNF